MVHPLVLTVASLLVVASASAEIDFTPTNSFYVAEATKVPCVAFHNGDKVMQYSPPEGWKLGGGGNKITLTPTNTPQAEATMATRPSKPSIPATNENVKAYSELAVRMLPRGAAKVTVVDAAVSSMQKAGRPMIEVNLTYVLFAQQFSMNILFLPHDDELVTFQMVARTPDFGSLENTFRRSLFSLQGL
ncbi:hypothetical protein CfE428DRAFT_6626 [Chthoniobacter flavus Ellin428]|uniref:DUF1795 domain-containing protein n=1 Tax=Chthoniobacter flavus Ellin428 TaxID=497964 RepID=B4DCI5_9BACT|nr:hypothetical protein [Chthoniobacter flavus]EDY15861.1 hypothetical protein CfE428DRAFT_6626 [Chthoniobacter flavus Ellin428]TCO84232.1 hypothetical protein EV701_13726 [Chthoniobacter flavus]